MEEEPPAPSMAFQYEMLGKESSSGVNMPSVEDMMETSISPCVSSEDMALVLYKPVDNPVLFGPGISGISFIVSSDVLLGLKSKLIMLNLLSCHFYLHLLVLFLFLRSFHLSSLQCKS
jgi:hypothetical protein